ncbi:superoxide dismutase [Candidatus Deianiraea vastatrix]|uniref:Superoxide dismutase n=1 Tax=Candidatus Deianiraea vastatrix TaxID=2163644 RepID=A0A5B8XGU4_9RICK|nr:superoxide dismutase [Candidatus Deianiraea vastatrix]QED23381.1 Superoxide dismutase [Candidatus Deianiraea vastatrix]
MTISLEPLPYLKDALSPYISEETVTFHHEKHHAAYVNNLNNLIKGTEMEAKSLEEIIMLSAEDASKAAIFNNAAQVWNHTFYFKCMHPNGGDEPASELVSEIEKYFGSFDEFKNQFKTAATTQFGSGWAWLVKDKDGSLKIVKTPNAATPMTSGQKPLLTIDVWEHAYYLDYQNRRVDYIDVFLSKLANWSFVLENLK